MYDKIITDLRKAYDQKVEERDSKSPDAWKIEERQRFLTLLQAEGKSTLLEIGAGTGVHGKFFQENGLDIICTDLSPEMVQCCRDKGLTAYPMDFLNLDFPAHSFDALFAMNCLLHVPWAEFKNVLSILQSLLKPGGLFYLGQYGGREQAGIRPEDHYEPKRFFSFLSDAQMQAAVTQFFELLFFAPIPLEWNPKEAKQGNADIHIQSLILRQK
ncbi:MAG TPA: class I SAM-dependent methyltransferase [Anaerolineae bacterium]|jgi:SAM-dependent methyltransferase